MERENAQETRIRTAEPLSSPPIDPGTPTVEYSLRIPHPWKVLRRSEVLLFVISHALQNTITMTTSRQSSPRCCFISIPGPREPLPRSPHLSSCYVICSHLAQPTAPVPARPGPTVESSSTSKSPVSKHSSILAPSFPIPTLFTDPHPTRVPSPTLTPYSPAAQENVVGPGSGEREELV